MADAPEVDAEMSREEGLLRLARLAERLHISPGAIRVRPCSGAVGMTISLAIAGGTLTKTCTSQHSKDKNFVCLVLWLGDLVRNVERGIETFAEAFYNEGARDLALRSGDYDRLRSNEYLGDATREDSLNMLERALERLGMSRADARLTWDAKSNTAQLRLRLRSGRTVAKASTLQKDVDRNIHALALWLRTKAKNHERGLEADLDELFAANLLPA